MASHRELAIVEEVTRRYYEVLPAELRTYCSAGSRVTQHALALLGVDSTLLPCQLMYSGPQLTYLIGFTRREPRQPGKWDGHVVCAGDDWLVDGAVYHLTAEFGITVPRIVCQKRFTVPSQAIARCDLSPTERLWWHHPPAGFDPTPPEEPADIVHTLGRRLAEEVAQRLNAPASV